AAHLLIVLKVAGATTTASAFGSSSGSSGIRNSVRTRSPVMAANNDASMNRSPIGVAITRTTQPSARARETRSSTLEAAGAAQTTTYSTPGGPPLAFISSERSPPFCAWCPGRHNSREHLGILSRDYPPYHSLHFDSGRCRLSSTEI